MNYPFFVISETQRFTRGELVEIKMLTVLFIDNTEQYCYYLLGNMLRRYLVV